jgi:dUTP pyrophosphatase
MTGSIEVQANDDLTGCTGFQVKATLRRIHDGEDVGWDIRTNKSAIIWPFTCKDLHTGLNIKMPAGVWGSMKARSSTLYKRKLMVLEGVFDPGYRGPLSVVVFNPTPWPRLVRAGERLAQMVLIPIVDDSGIRHVLNFSTSSQRKDKGFGSSGF